MIDPNHVHFTDPVYPTVIYRRLKFRRFPCKMHLVYEDYITE